MRSSSDEVDILATLFAFSVEAIMAGSKATVELIDDKLNKEVKKGKLREKLSILEYQEDAKNKRSFYTPNEDEENRIVDCIKLEDPDFNKELFEKFALDVFKKFQKAYCENNLNSVRKFVDINVIEAFSIKASQNEMLKYKETIDVVSDNFVDFFGYHKEGGTEVVSVAISIVYKDYIKDEEGKIIKGDERINQRGVFILSFSRKEGGKTINNIKDYSKNSVVRCPNCGAEIVNSFSQCDSCGTTLFNSTENWLMTYIEPL